MVSNLSFESFKIKNIPNSGMILINSPLPWFNKKKDEIDKNDINEAITETIKTIKDEQSSKDKKCSEDAKKHLPKISSIPNMNNLLYILCFILIIFYILNYL